MKGIGPGLGDHADLAAAELAVFGVEVAGEDAELGDGIEVGNDGRAHVDVFLDVAAVEHETVGEFALAVDGDGAGSSGRPKGEKGADADILGGCSAVSEGDRGHAGLQRKQVSAEAAAVQRHGCHLLAGDDLASLSVGGFHMSGGFGDGDGSGFIADGEGGVDYYFAVDVDGDGGAEDGFESAGLDGKVVGADGEALEGVKAAGIGGGGLGDGGGGFGGCDAGAGDGAAGGIGDGAEEAAAVAGVQEIPRRARRIMLLQVSCI